MPGFEEHLRKGVVGVSVIGVAATYSFFQDRMVEFILPFLILGSIGAVLPDIDIRSSKPRKMLGKFSVIGMPIVPLWLVFTKNIVKETLLNLGADPLGSFAPTIPNEVKLLAIFAVLGGVLLRFGAYILDTLVSHRGVLHKPMTGFACAVVLGYVGLQHASHIAPTVSHIGAASGLLVGFLVHLQLDGEIL